MRLRELRKNRGLRQKDIAETIGVSPQSYGYYENGVNKPDPEMLIKLADFFQCSTDYLLGREDDIGNIVIQNETAAPQLSESEQKLLNSFRRLPFYGRIANRLRGVYPCCLRSLYHTRKRLSIEKRCPLVPLFLFAFLRRASPKRRSRGIDFLFRFSAGVLAEKRKSAAVFKSPFRSLPGFRRRPSLSPGIKKNLFRFLSRGFGATLRRRRVFLL